MKGKISISLEKELLEKLEEYAKDSIFRNKSHVVELALNKFLMENKK